jgi:hypothetical protein
MKANGRKKSSFTRIVLVSSDGSWRMRRFGLIVCARVHITATVSLCKRDTF